MFCGQVFGPAFLQLPLSGGMWSNRAELCSAPSSVKGMAPSLKYRGCLGLTLGLMCPGTQKMLDSQSSAAPKVKTHGPSLFQSTLTSCKMFYGLGCQHGRKEPSLGFRMLWNVGRKHPDVQVCVSQDVGRHLFIAHGTPEVKQWGSLGRGLFSRCKASPSRWQPLPAVFCC